MPIEWGFTDTTEGHFYAVQLDYSGATLAAGYIYAGTLYVFKYDSALGKYVLAFSHQESGNYGRRAQITLDGKYIVVGGIDYPYLDIWEYDEEAGTYTRVAHYQLPDTGGLGGLGISDPYNVGYVIGGTKNGWVIIAHFNTTTKEFKVIYQAKEAPDDSWIYNPFYERWIPKVTEVFALASKDGIGVVYDVITNTTIKINYGGSYEYWKAAAVSPESNYVFVGNSLYMVVKRDVQSGTPRIRLWGNIHYPWINHSLSQPLILKPPSRDWQLYFQSGRLTITRLFTLSEPVDLVEDEDISNGRLAKLYDRGLVSAKTLYTEYAEVSELDVVPGTEIADILAGEGITHPENYIATLNAIRFTPPPYLWEGHAWIGTRIHIPIDKPISIYDNMTLQLSTSVYTGSLLYDKDKRALGVLGIPIEIGGGIGISATAYSRIANKILIWYASKHAVDVAKVAGIATSQSVAKVAGIAGIAIAVWGGIDAALIKWGGFGDIYNESLIVMAPVVEDQYGNKYTALQFELPLEESGNIEKYYDAVSTYFKDELGYKDVGVRAHYPWRTWEEFKDNLAKGYTPIVYLDNLIEETIASKHNLDINKLKIVGVDVIIITMIRVKETFWEWFFGLGGVSIDTVTFIGTASISVEAVLKEQIITDPSKIASTLGKVTINGIEYELYPGDRGAYTDFSYTLGTEILSIDFGRKKGYYADLEIDADVIVEKLFQQLDDFGYTATLHYDWKDVELRLERIEFADMPYPMYKAERIYIYSYGTFTNDITDAFELLGSVQSTLSPTGIFYYYITRENTKYFDPTNGGTLQYGEKTTFNYFYKEPPDAGIRVLLNGTSITSTLAHHATVVVDSSVEQTVIYKIDFYVNYLEGVTEKTMNHGWKVDVLKIPANGTAYRIYDISRYVNAALEIMKTWNKTAFLKIIARIDYADYDYYKANNEYKIVYYPSLRMPPPIPEGPFNVTVRTYEYNISTNSWEPSPNTLVEVYFGYNVTESEIVYSNTTDENGETSFILNGGTWTFRAHKEGFIDDYATITLFNDTTVNLYLSPVPQPSSENRTYIEENVTVTFKVYDATNGSAIPDANITLVFTEPVNSTYYNTTFEAVTDSIGEAEITIPAGYYNVTVNATGYKLFEAQYLFDKDTIVNIPLVQEGINENNYAHLEVKVLYADGKPYTGAHVEIYNATDMSLIAALATNSLGNATLLLPINQDYNITVSVSEPLYNRSYTDSKVISLTQDTVVTFTLPWKSPQPPMYIEGRPYYWLSVQVVWNNGLPFHGAIVEIFNYTSGQLIDSLETNGTGTVHFLLPAFQKYVIWVNATNPYNTTQNYQRILIVNLTDHRWITIKLPWLPEEAELAQKYRVLVYAYDITTGEGIPDVTVVMRKGDIAWTAETNSTGYAELWIPLLGLYNVTGIHPDYDTIWRTIQIYENNTLLNLPLSPVLISTELYPPLNGTEYPPIYINGTPHYWLSVQVLYQDGYPFHGANVTVYDLDTGEVMFTRVTNGTGFVHFLIPENESIRYTVDAVNPENASETFHAEKTLNMTQHYYFVHNVPWTSIYYTPEVWLMNVSFVIHIGRGYYFGNMSHLVLLEIWTNKPQNVTVLIALYNVTGETWVNNKTVNITLEEGVNTIFEWVDVNATEGGNFRVFVNITEWEYDTDPTNNWRWSNTVYLKPFVDIQVSILWKPVEQKQVWTILPEDIIEICIGVSIPINTTDIPAKLEWRIDKYNLKEQEFEPERSGEEEIRAARPGVIWRNITLAIPWTSRIIVTVNATHEWEALGLNNYMNLTIEIDPDVKLSIAEKPTTVIEGSTYKVVINLTSNVEPGGGIGWVALEDNTTGKLIKRVEIELAPEKRVEIEAKAPENPSTFWIFRAPTTTHQITAQFAGYDLYLENNKDEFTLTVMSYQWLTIIAGIVIIIAIIAAFRALTHTIYLMRKDRRKYVKRRTSFLTESIHDLAEEYKYVKKKKD